MKAKVLDCEKLHIHCYDVVCSIESSHDFLVHILYTITL